MMAESGDDANHESTFEIVHSQQFSTTPASESVSPPNEAGSIPNLPPPAALPAFASLSGSTGLASTPPISTAPPPPLPPTQISAPPPPRSAEINAVSGGNPFSIRAAFATSQQHPQTVTMPPMPTAAPDVMMPPPMTEGASPYQFITGQLFTGSGVEIPFDILPHDSTLTSSSADGSSIQQEGGAGGVLGWFRGVVNNSAMLSKVAETAKNSMEGVIATLDPQMKEYMNNRGLLDIVVTLDRDEEVRAMRDGISNVFPHTNIRPFIVAAGLNGPAQPIGFVNAFHAAQQKITYIRNSGYADQTSLIVGSEGFVVEAMPETWLYFDCLVLDDAVRQVQVHSFTQPVQVPVDIVQLLKDHTQADYPYKDLGYAVSVSHAMTHLWSLGPLEWQERLTGINRSDLLKNAASALAYSYRAKF